MLAVSNNFDKFIMEQSTLENGAGTGISQPAVIESNLQNPLSRNFVLRRQQVLGRTADQTFEQEDSIQIKYPQIFVSRDNYLWNIRLVRSE